MKQVHVGILGATGAVGQEMMKILEERDFPVASLRPIASSRSAGGTLRFRGEDVTIAEANDSAFEGLDIVLGARRTTSPRASPRRSSRRGQCSWTTPARSALIPGCRW